MADTEIMEEYTIDEIVSGKALLRYLEKRGIDDEESISDRS